MKFENKVVLITGASSGIGEGVAQYFLNEGAKIIGCGIEKSMKFDTDKTLYVSADLTKPEDAKLVVQQGVVKFGHIDKLICCAGVTGIGTLESTTYDSFMREIGINLGGDFNICKATMPELMKVDKPTAVLVSSDLSETPMPGRIAYCPSKAGVNMLMQCLAVEYAPKIRVNSIQPGIVRTPMTEKRFTEADDPKAVEEMYSNLYLLKRIGKIEDMTNAIGFLSSDESAFLTGESIHVSGGSQLHATTI